MHHNEGTPQASVIIPCRNEAAHIERVLDALRRQNFGGMEVLVIDGMSTDSTPAVIREYAARHPDFQLKLFINPRVTTPSALNLGVHAARSKIIVRLDGHAIPATDYIRRCVETLKRSGAEVVGGRWIVQPGGSGVVAEAIALAVSSPLGAGDAIYRLTGSHPAGDTDTVPFGCFRKATWKALGGFDERLLSNEDYDFNYRVRRAGGRVFFNPAIQCIYLSRSKLSDLWGQYFRYGWWKAQMLRRHPHSLRWRQALLPVFVGGVVGLSWAALFWSAARWFLAGLLVAYVGVCLAASLWLAAAHRAWRALVMLPWAFVSIHFAWGIGAWIGAVSFGRWPRWGRDEGDGR